MIAETHAFERGEAIAHQNLAEIDTVVAALSRAITIPADIWVPFPLEDLGLEQHVRRLDLALKSHGRALLLGNRLVPCPPDGYSAIDRALRTEVHAVNDLCHAALAATAVQTLYAEIQQVISTTAAVIPEDDTDSSTWLPRLDAEHGPDRRIPPPIAPWNRRRPGLKALARWLVEHCGLTQGEAANALNATGHRTPQGRPFCQATVSMLLRGRYDGRAAA